MTVFKPGDRVHLKGHAHTPATTGTAITENPTAVYVRWDDNHTTTPHHPQHLEPAGEPMSTTFKSSSQASDSRTLSVDRLYGDPRLLISGENRIGFMVDPSDAPALALAILEAAGITDKGFNESSDAEMAVAHLASHVGLERANAKEAADREALEVEALTLCRIMWGNPDQAWTPMSPEAKAKWLKMARTARELHGVTK